MHEHEIAMNSVIYLDETINDTIAELSSVLEDKALDPKKLRKTLIPSLKVILHGLRNWQNTLR